MVVDVWHQSLYPWAQSFPSVPLTCFVAGFTYFLRTIFGIIFQVQCSNTENLNAVNKNQEKYREEYGYTIEEWYGKKSKMYKEHVKKSKKR